MEPMGKKGKKRSMPVFRLSNALGTTIEVAGSPAAAPLFDPGKVLFSMEQAHKWDLTADPAEHIWYPQETRKSDICGICKSKFSMIHKEGLTCSCCHIRVHEACCADPDALKKNPCRKSFEIGESSGKVLHHWVPGMFEQKKICELCSKSIGQLVGFKSASSLRCAWCKRTVHRDCLDKQKEGFSECDLGSFRLLIVPASHIVMTPRPSPLRPIESSSDAHDAHSGDDVGSTSGDHTHSEQAHTPTSLSVPTRQDSLRSASSAEDEDGHSSGPLTKAQRKHRRRSLKRQSKREQRLREAQVLVTISALPYTTPLLVFINPKSGGNQGAKLLAQLQWILNPRQVFNLMAKPEHESKPQGPRKGIELFRDVANLRILVCGGDGTVGWVLSTLDSLNMSSQMIPIGTIPLGTGNDLARELKWGGGYEGEPIPKILLNVMSATTTKLDRWQVVVQRRGEIPSSTEDDIPVVETLPQSVFNNYFSIGSDAYTALKFHLAREANPKKFDSRIKNKTYYGMLGAKEALQHKFQRLSADMTLMCDGVDKTELLRKKSIEAIAFLNVSSYAAGTRPWGTKTAVDEFTAPALDDGKLEVVGFLSAWEMAKGQMGVGHALRICQCSEAVLITKKPLPIQMDGEPCMLAPSQIRVSKKNQAMMLCRPKGRYKKLEEKEGRKSESSDEDESDHLLEARHHRDSMVSNPDLDDWSDREEQYGKLNVYTVDNVDGRTTIAFVKELNVPYDMPLAGLRLMVRSLLGAEYDSCAFMRAVSGDGGTSFQPVSSTDESSLQCKAFIAHPQTSSSPSHSLNLSVSGPSSSSSSSAHKAGIYVAKPQNVPSILRSPLPDDSTLQKPKKDESNLVDRMLKAAILGDLPVIEDSLARGVNVNANDETGMTALHFATENNRIGVLMLLLQNNADPNATNYQEKTPLHIAAAVGSNPACKVLFDSGSDPNKKDKFGQTPLDYAINFDRKDMYKLLSTYSPQTKTIKTVQNVIEAESDV